MYTIKDQLTSELSDIRSSGLYKDERVITTAQDVEIEVEGREGKFLNFCANNYLGLSSHQRVIQAAHKALDTHGYGMSSVRFICGTEDLHKQLEHEISLFLDTEDAILYMACFDANGGVFEPLFGENDAIISDELNHASIIDGVRLSKAERYRYKNCDMLDLERCLIESKHCRRRVIVTDGVFDPATVQKFAGLVQSDHAFIKFPGSRYIRHWNGDESNLFYFHGLTFADEFLSRIFFNQSVTIRTGPGSNGASLPTNASRILR